MRDPGGRRRILAGAAAAALLAAGRRPARAASTLTAAGSGTLAFVVRPDRLAPEARAFVDFARSRDGARLLAASGYAPVQ